MSFREKHPLLEEELFSLAIITQQRKNLVIYTII